jgi:signal transduction histidine kinase
VRRAYVAEITARAVRAEQTREAEASRRVAEDRLRIARDLHDAVAHQITVISLHAGVASASIEGRPDTARASLQTIREAARRVLGEIGDLLATLRSSEDAEPPVRSPGLAHLAGLLDGFGSSGLDVTARVDGDVARLSPAADAVAYRVVQEGLTNALRHGSGPVHVSISVGPESTDLLVVNPVEARPGRDRMGSGHGLAGISERVAAVRGHVSHGADDGMFRLAVTFPTSNGTHPEKW